MLQVFNQCLNIKVKYFVSRSSLKLTVSYCHLVFNIQNTKPVWFQVCVMTLIYTATTNTNIRWTVTATVMMWQKLACQLYVIYIFYVQGAGTMLGRFTSSGTKQIEYYDVALNQFSSASHSHTAGQLKRHFPVWCLLFTYCTASIWLWFILMLNYNSLIELVFTSSIKYPWADVSWSYLDTCWHLKTFQKIMILGVGVGVEYGQSLISGACRHFIIEPTRKSGTSGKGLHFRVRQIVQFWAYFSFKVWRTTFLRLVF